MTSPVSSPASLGERLQDARKRRGLSLRDAAEATKIRSDFLSAMEDNSLAIDLPEVYRRGFLKSYARFLKLDPERAIAEYEDIVSRTGSRGDEHASAATRRKSLGRFEIKGHDADTRAASGRADQPISGGDDLSDSSPGLLSPAAIKILGIVGGLALCVTIGVWALHDNPTSNGTQTGTTPYAPAPTPTPVPTAVPTAALSNRTPSSVTVRATKSVKVTITDIATRKVIFDSTIVGGLSITRARINGGQVRIDISDLSAVMLSKDGQVEEQKFERSGPGYAPTF